MSEFKLIIIPDPEEPEAAEVYVDGTIAGRPYRFLLDTGAATSSVVWDDYTSEFGSIEKHDSSGVFARHSDDLIIVPSIEIGPVSKHNFMLARMAAPNSQRRNLIGMDLLKDFCCHFYFDENRVSVDATKEDSYDFQELVLDNRFHPYIDVRFGTVKASAVWDTGSGITVVDTNFIKEHPAFFQQAGQSVGTDSSGSTMETPMFLMSAAVMGNQTFPPHRVAGVDFSHVNSTIEIPMDLVLGYSTLSKANWLFDFPRRKWAISKWLGPQ